MLLLYIVDVPFLRNWINVYLEQCYSMHENLFIIKVLIEKNSHICFLWKILHVHVCALAGIECMPFWDKMDLLLQMNILVNTGNMTTQPQCCQTGFNDNNCLMKGVLFTLMWQLKVLTISFCFITVSPLLALKWNMYLVSL